MEQGLELLVMLHTDDLKGDVTYSKCELNVSVV